MHMEEMAYLCTYYNGCHWSFGDHNVHFIVVYTRGVQKVRSPTKKENEFYDETRCEGCDVSKTTPDAVTS